MDIHSIMDIVAFAICNRDNTYPCLMAGDSNFVVTILGFNSMREEERALIILIAYLL